MPDVDKKQCNKPSCEGREKISDEGKCQICEDFTIVDKDGTACVKPECKLNEKILTDGVCTPCEAFTTVSDDK